MGMSCRLVVVLVLTLFAIGAGATGQRAVVGAFVPGSLDDWQTKSFKGYTDYTLIGSGPDRVLKASCQDTASAIALRVNVDLTKTPILHWSWRVDHVHPGLNGTMKQGDDYAARVYVIHDGGWFFWQTGAVNYVWANGKPVGSHWPNAFTDKAMMVAVQSGPPEQPGQWVQESRNVRVDFRKFYGLELKTLDGIAIMTDCDNSGLPAVAWYRNIYFSAK